MTVRALAWRIDPAEPRPPWQALFTAGSEHHRAVARLQASAAARVLPDETWLHLHGYELLEAMAGAAAADRAHVQFPFWPACLFAAAGVRAHGAREFAACMPEPTAVACVLPEPSAVADAAQREFGALRFDAEYYCWALRAAARQHGWQVEEGSPRPLPPWPSPLVSAGRRAAAGGIVIDGGSLLLERRADAARVYAGMWDTPGGHLGPDETPERALRRELAEELGIEVTAARLLLVQDDRDPTSGADYRHFVHVVDAFRGQPRARHGQRLLALPIGDCLRLHRLNPLVAAALRRLLDAGELAFG